MIRNSIITICGTMNIVRKNNDNVTPDLMKSIVNQLQYHSIDESISVSHIEDESYWKHECKTTFY